MRIFERIYDKDSGNYIDNYRDMTPEEIEASNSFNPYEGMEENEIMKELLSAKYSIEDRLELLFEMFTNPTAAVEYFAYLKECRQKAKEFFKKK
jgi:hypothetical protein